MIFMKRISSRPSDSGGRRHDAALRRDHAATIQYLSFEQRNRYLNGMYVEIPPPRGWCDASAERTHDWHPSMKAWAWMRHLLLENTDMEGVRVLKVKPSRVTHMQGLLCCGFFALAEYFDNCILIDLQEQPATTVPDARDGIRAAAPGTERPLLQEIGRRMDSREEAVRQTVSVLSRFFEVSVVGDNDIIRLTNPRFNIKQQPFKKKKP